eukprot:3219302-Prymnesium_polylepis.1
MAALLVRLLAVPALVLPPSTRLRTTMPRAPVASAQALDIKNSDDLGHGLLSPPALEAPRRLAEEDPAT